MSYDAAPARGSCPTGKVQFATRKQARKGRQYRALKGQGLSVYRCDDCGFFHLGHLPDRVRNGEIDKDAWIRAKGSA